jgi:hypothetical protein
VTPPAIYQELTGGPFVSAKVAIAYPFGQDMVRFGQQITSFRWQAIPMARKKAGGSH